MIAIVKYEAKKTSFNNKMILHEKHTYDKQLSIHCIDQGIFQGSKEIK